MNDQTCEAKLAAAREALAPFAALIDGVPRTAGNFETFIEYSDCERARSCCDEMLEIDNRIADLEKRNELLRLYRARLYAANTYYMQMLVTLGPATFVNHHIEAADKAAASVRREDLVSVTLNNQEKAHE